MVVVMVMLDLMANRPANAWSYNLVALHNSTGWSAQCASRCAITLGKQLGAMQLNIVGENDYHAFAPKDIDHAAIIWAWPTQHTKSFSLRNGDRYSSTTRFCSNRQHLTAEYEIPTSKRKITPCCRGLF
jgi:hypothetical protein